MSAEGAARAWETGTQVVVKGKEADGGIGLGAGSARAGVFPTVVLRAFEEAARVARVELSNVPDLMRCPRKLFLHERLQALQVWKVRSYISSDPSSNCSTVMV